MSEGIRRAITSLGTIEDRLRRALNLAGEVSAVFTPAAIPVVLAADATAPGCSVDRGKRFAVGFTQLVSANPGTTGIEARQSIVITSIRMIGTASIGTTILVRHIVPETAADFAMTAAGGGLTSWSSAWMERPASNNDFPPVFGGLNGVSSFATGRQATVHVPTGVWVPVLDAPFFLEGPRTSAGTGARLTFTTSAAVANSAMVIEGYVF